MDTTDTKQKTADELKCKHLNKSYSPWYCARVCDDCGEVLELKEEKIKNLVARKIPVTKEK